MTKKFLFLLLFLFCLQALAQENPVALREVIIADQQLNDFSETQSVRKLSDSAIFDSRPTLRSLLNDNSLIYFKENGPGSVATVSFRGTTAQQTAVIWNGININSQFNGLIDFNTITTTDFNSVDVRAGGGSILYGSSAIGGSVHLENELTFKDQFTNNIYINYGSFNTVQTNYRLTASNRKITSQFSFSSNSSDNNFEYPDGSKNINGEFSNKSFSSAIGFKLDKRNNIKFYSHYFNGDRHFSLRTPSDTRSKYKDLNVRNLVVWTNTGKSYRSTLRAAYIGEDYKFFENIAVADFYHGSSDNFVVKYDLLKELTDNFTINPVVEYNYIEAEGSDIQNAARKVASAALLLKHQIFSNLLYEIGLRKEQASNYDSPFLYNGGVRYDVTPKYQIAANFSKNFRIPSFNDLYWRDGGNAGLKPETSTQFQLRNEFATELLQLSITGYYNNIDDLIQWLPGTSTLWRPENVHQVKSYGIEASAAVKYNIGEHRTKVNGDYGYTVSENTQTEKQLIYVPFHKFILNATYTFSRLAVDFRTVFNGEVFTRTDNNPLHTIDPYSLSDAGVSYGFIAKNISAEFGARAQNIFDIRYEVTEGRMYPGRNFNIYLNLKL